MSVFSQLKRIAIKDDSISTEEYLGLIHQNLLKQIQKKKLSTEEIQAKKIQIFLRQIKYIQKNGSFQDGKIDFSSMTDFPFSPLWSKIAQQSLMDALYQAHPKLFTSGLLVKTDDQSYLLGNYLEWGVQQVLNTFESAVTGEDYYKIKEKRKMSSVGTQHIQIPDLIESGNEIMKNQFYEMYAKMQKEVNKRKKETESSKIGNFTPSVQGKVDIQSFIGDIQLSGDIQLTPYIKSMLNALKDVTFTAKNYISTKELKFGQTNPFRIFMTVAPSGSEGVGRFERMLTCFESHVSVHREAPQLFYRIKAIYELTGIGTKYTDSAFNDIFQGSGAKFLVWNNPIGDIYVIPTQKIISSIIEDSALNGMPKNWQDALYGPVSIRQVNIAELAFD